MILPKCLRLIGALAMLFPTPDLCAAPVGSWTFDETTGTTAADSSGNGLNFTLFGSPSWTAGQSNGALAFNGTTTYGRVADSPLFDGTDKLTIPFG